MAQKYSHEQIMAMSPEEKESLKQQLLAEKARMSQAPQASPYAQARPTLGQSLGRSLLMGTQAYTTGQIPKEAYESVSPSTTEPDWYTKQQIEQEQAKEMEKYKSGLKSKGPILKQLKDGSLVKINPDTYEMETLVEARPKEKTANERLAEIKLDEKEQAKIAAGEAVRSKSREMLDIIKNVKEGADYFGPYGNLPTIATSLGGIVDYEGRKKWENYTKQLLAKKGFDMMTELKNASRTGATGLGQLSEKEGAWLREASTALSRDISKEDAVTILTEMERLYNKVLAGETSEGQVGGNIVRMTDANGNEAEVEVDANGNPIRVVREL